MTDDEFIARVPTLEHIPAEWEGLRFYSVEAVVGEVLVMGDNEFAAERAALAYFGSGSRPAVKRWDDGTPVHASHPVHRATLLSGPGQYLDSVRVLGGDDCEPAMRMPDGSPALSRGAMFRASCMEVDRQRTMHEDIRDELDGRDAWLDSDA